MEAIAPRVMEQQRRGLDVALTFSMHDEKETGVISAGNFLEALRQLGIRLADPTHLQLLCATFSGNGGGGGGADNGGATMLDGSSSFGTDEMVVNYAAFLDAIKTVTAASKAVDTPSSRRGGGGGRGGGDFDGGKSVRRRLSLEASRQLEPDDFLSTTFAGRPGFDRRASFESIVNHSTANSPTSGRRRGEGFSRSSSSGGVPPMSPSREAAVALWGADTPLKEKGTLPQHTRNALEKAGKWMCLTCLYADNPSSARDCTVCGGPNTTTSSSSSSSSSSGATVRRECPACHFHNSEYATHCGMCSRALVSSSSGAFGGGSGSGDSGSKRDRGARGARRRDGNGNSGWRDEEDGR